MSIVYRQELGRELTWSEADNNFAELKAGVDSKKSNFDVLPVTQGGTGQTTVDAVKVAFDIATKTDLASSSAGKGAELVEYHGATVEAALNERLPEIGNYAGLDAYTGDAAAVLVYGVQNIFDGGAGVFRRTTDTPAAVNGIYRQDALGRWWKRDYSGPLNPDWFVGTDVQKLQAVFDKAKTDYSSIVLPRLFDITGGTIYLDKNSVRDQIHVYGVNHGGIKKTDAGFMFSSNLAFTSDYVFHSVLFDGGLVANMRVFNGGKILYIYTHNCHFKRCYTAFYAPDYTAGIGNAYLQGIFSSEDHIIGCNGPFIDAPAGYIVRVENFSHESNSGQLVSMREAVGGSPYSGCYDWHLTGLTEGNSYTDAGIMLFRGSIEKLTIDAVYFESNIGGHIEFGAGTTIHNLTISNCRHGGPQEGRYVLNEAVTFTAYTGSGTGATGTVSARSSVGGVQAVAITNGGSGFVVNDLVYITSALGTGGLGKVTAVSGGAITAIGVVNQGNNLIKWGNADVKSALVSGNSSFNTGIHNYVGLSFESIKSIENIKNRTIYSGRDLNDASAHASLGYSDAISSDAAGVSKTKIGQFTRYTCPRQTVSFTTDEVKTLTFNFGADTAEDSIFEIQVLAAGAWAVNHYRTGAAGSKTLVVTIKNLTGGAAASVPVRATMLVPFASVTG